MLTLPIKPEIQSQIAFAATLLKQGKLVAIPTETVYGLAADASQPKAIHQIFMAKGRPSNHPLIVHLADVAQIWDWGKSLSQETIEDIKQLAAHFWPGPLTIVIKKADWVPSIITGDQDTVAIRIPNHPLTLELLKQMPYGLVAPSANRFGRISPTLAAHVLKELGNKVDYILEGGPCAIGLESTILNLSGEQPTPSIAILRPGMISAEQIALVLNKPILNAPKQNNALTPIRAPGLLNSHYAPKTPFYRITENALSTEALISKLNAIFADSKIALISHHSLSNISNLKNSLVSYHALSSDPGYFSQQIYATLHHLDALGFDFIFCHLDQKIIHSAEWLSLLDRLQKATLGCVESNQLYHFKHLKLPLYQQDNQHA